MSVVLLNGLKGTTALFLYMMTTLVGWIIVSIMEGVSGCIDHIVVHLSAARCCCPWCLCGVMTGVCLCLAV